MQSKRVSSSSVERLLARRRRRVISTSSPSPISSTIAVALALVVLDHQQVLDAALDERRDPGERLVERSLRRPASRGTPRAGAAARLLPLVAGRDDVDGDVPRLRVVLEPVEQRPAVDHRQLHVEHDRVRLDSRASARPLSPRMRDEPLKPRSRAIPARARERPRRPRRSGRSGRRRRSSLAVVLDVAGQQEGGDELCTGSYVRSPSRGGDRRRRASASGGAVYVEGR